jgi:spectinomycin phosphotransferase
MLEPPPNVPDAAIAAALRAHYGLPVSALTFLPLGNDSASAAYRVDTAGGAAYFLKVRIGAGFSAASVEVPQYLRKLNVPHILSPRPTNSGALWVRVDEFAVALYPFVDGSIGGDIGLSDEQWTALGHTLKQVHNVQLSRDLMKILPREAFTPSRRNLIDPIETMIARGDFTDPLDHEFAALWSSHLSQILTLVNRVDSIGPRLRDTTPTMVLCHADLHSRNVLVEKDGNWWLVDWDEPVLAPKERDLMFVVGGIARRLIQPHQTEAFFRGYGETTIDPLALAYYRYAWAVQDIASYAERIVLLPGMSQNSKRESLDRFQTLFDPGNIVEIALASAVPPP